MSLELRTLRSFIAVADEMHFSRAARKLNLAQPALTAQIKQLEESIGAQLFHRSNRMGGLTAAGRALLPEAKRLLDHAGSLKACVARAVGGEAGRLRLGIIPPAATSTLAEGLRVFAKKFPEIEISARQGDQARLLERLEAHELDLVIGREVATGHDLVQSRLFIEEQGIVIRADDSLAAKKAIPIKQLGGRKLLLLQSNPHFGQLLLGHAATFGVNLVPEHLAEDFGSLHWMVRAGLGIAPCSLLLADALPLGLTARPIRPAPDPLPINGIWPRQNPEPSVHHFLETIGQLSHKSPRK